MTTTTAATPGLTAGPTTGPTTPNTQSKTCDTPLDYALVRKNNITTITKQYQDLLSTYTKTYADYSIQLASTNPSDKANAELILKPQTEAYNTQIINISTELLKSVNTDTDLIVEQTKELEKQAKKLDILMNDIKLLKDKSTELKILEQSQEDNVKNTQSGSDDLHFTSQIYMGMNILLVLIIIGLIIYLVYTNFTSKKYHTNITNGTNSTNGTNAMNGMTNLYKNIKVNTQ